MQELSVYKQGVMRYKRGSSAESVHCLQNACALHDLSGPSWGSSQREGLPDSKDVETSGQETNNRAENRLVQSEN